MLDSGHWLLVAGDWFLAPEGFEAKNENSIFL